VVIVAYVGKDYRRAAQNMSEGLDWDLKFETLCLWVLRFLCTWWQRTEWMYVRDYESILYGQTLKLEGIERSALGVRRQVVSGLGLVILA
jgi:hypothetical protein